MHNDHSEIENKIFYRNFLIELVVFNGTRGGPLIIFLSIMLACFILITLKASEVAMVDKIKKTISLPSLDLIWLMIVLTDKRRQKTRSQILILHRLQFYNFPSFLGNEIL